ncbi:hemolysin TlyA family protein [Candidatus Magnetoovum chiemensis]|nr:hemolysin TlyA family protein [Candidatus Magnetoovum chiemensis]
MKKRLDILLIERGMCTSRERAKELILENKVFVNSFIATKPGSLVDEACSISVKEKESPFVSRGGVKIDFALNFFNISVDDIIVMDVGASTGGFTDCVLQRGAKKVYALDVGYGQLAWKLRNNPKVIAIERTNIRYMEKDKVADLIALAVIDVSFISLKKVIPKVVTFLKPDGQILALIKPQFEDKKEFVNKGGIVKDQNLSLQIVEEVKEFVKGLSMNIKGICESPITGQKGNTEYFIYCALNV